MKLRTWFAFEIYYHKFNYQNWYLKTSPITTHTIRKNFLEYTDINNDGHQVPRYETVSQISYLLSWKIMIFLIN